SPPDVPFLVLSLNGSMLLAEPTPTGQRSTRVGQQREPRRSTRRDRNSQRTTGRRRDIASWPSECGQDLGSLTMRQQDGLKNLPIFLLFLLSQRRGLGDDCLVATCSW